MADTKVATVGHNSGGIAVDRLRNIVERIERLVEERKSLTADINDIYTEAKSSGFDKKVLRTLIRIRGLDREKLEEEEELLDTYRHALGE